MEVRPGPPGGPPKRPRTWLGAAGVLGLILGAVLLTTAADCSGQEEDPAASIEGGSLGAGPSRSPTDAIGA